MSHHVPSFQYKISLGQNFLFDEELLNRLVDKTGVGPQDVVLEIGAGRGDLTAVLAAHCRQVITIEVDERLEPVLQDRFSQTDNIRLVMGDVMQLDLGEIMRDCGPFHVVANLPYYLTSPILSLLLHAPLPIQSVNVMVQEEAAARILARPGTPEYGPLTVLAAYRGSPRATVRVPARMFTPPPKVDSMFLTIPFHKTPPVHLQDEALFHQLVQAAFQMRRKTLVNNLVHAFPITRGQAQGLLIQAGLPGQIRGERLSLQEFAGLSNDLADLLRESTEL